MSRRRPVDRAAARGGLTPADRSVSVDLIDPRGHRLVRVGRYLHDPDPESIWWDRSTVGRNVTFLYELEDEDDEGSPWRSVHFECKACRDSGAPMVSGIAVADVKAALRRSVDTPRRVRISTVAEQ